MKTRTKILTILGATMLLMLGDAVSVRQAAAEQKARLASGIASKLASLDITDAQKEQIRSILRNHREIVMPLIQDYVAERRALRDAVRSSPVNEDAIRAKSATIAGQQSDLAVELAYISQEIRNVLTPEQIEKVDTLLDERDICVDNILDRIGNRLAE